MALFKFSLTWTCRCGHVHIIQGPASCWVCGSTLDAYYFAVRQKGLNPRQAELDDMLWRMKYASLMRQRASYMGPAPDPAELGWPEEAGLGQELRSWLQ